MAVTDGVTGRIFHVMTALGSAAEREAMTVLRKAERFLFRPPYLTFDLFKGGIDFADQLAAHGLLQLPYDVVVFQFGPIHDEEEDAAYVVYDHVALAWMEDGHLCGRVYVAGISGVTPGQETYRIPLGTIYAEAIKDDNLLRTFVARDLSCPIRDEPDHETVGIRIFMMTMFGGLGCLGAAGVKLESVREPKFTNTLREKKGEAPVFGHNLVMIDMDQIRMPGVTRAGGSHASPRLHWRRGHIRRAASGKVSIVRPCLVGCAERGAVTKEYSIGAFSGSVLTH